MDKIRNRVLRERLGVVLIYMEMHESKLKWFGHVYRKSTNVHMRRTEKHHDCWKENLGMLKKT